MRILDFFPGTPRDAQVVALEHLEQSWGSHNAFVLSLPVAAGKSRVAYTLAQWLAARGTQAAIITPNNMLVDQYTAEFADLPVLRRADTYQHRGAFAEARARVLAAPSALSTYHAYVGNRLHKEVLIADEAHNILPMLQERWGAKLWQRQWQFPDDLQTVGDFVEWASVQRDKRLTDVIRDVVHDESVVLEFTEELWRGRPDRVLLLKPLTVRDKKPWLWPHQVRKVVLMSATVSEWEIYELGLDRRRVTYCEVDSPIPAGNRPVVALPVVNMAHATKPFAVAKLADYLRRLLDVRPGKGLLHVTYDVAARLRPILSHPRLVWHGRSDKALQYQAWRDGAPEAGQVLVACGMAEGIDLAYDAARWQVVTQVPFPYLGDSAVARKTEKQPEWFAWQTAKTLMQQFGRVCRAPDDYGETIITDAQFARFYRQHSGMFPQHVRSSIRIIPAFGDSVRAIT